MFKKAVSEDGKDGKYLIPYLLFACWEVPQSSTRFFPFQTAVQVTSTKATGYLVGDMRGQGGAQRVPYHMYLS